MNIYIVKSTGEGVTLLSAFDHALQNSGVHNYNLIPLSSIIPPASQIIEPSIFKTDPAEFGHKLYVVMAEMRSNEAGKFVAAGVGWYQLEDGRGFFVEHEIIGETEVAVRSEIELRIKNSLHDMCRFRKITFNEKQVKSAISLIQIKDKPACALSLAVYQSEAWR